MAKRKCSYIDGASLLSLFEERKIGDYTAFAQSVGVSTSTIYNYIHGSAENPKKAELRIIAKIAEQLAVGVECLTLSVAIPPAAKKKAAYRKIAGHWHVETSDLPIEELGYTSLVDWHADLVVEQQDRRLRATGVDRDGDEVIAQGKLISGGDRLYFVYRIKNPELDLFGTSLALLGRDGRTIDGVIVGGDTGQTKLGIAVSRLRMTRVSD